MRTVMSKRNRIHIIPRSSMSRTVLQNVGTHQYMTNVAAAASEGIFVKRAYSSNSNYPVIFEVPVYNSMPSSACQLP